MTSLACSFSNLETERHMYFQVVIIVQCKTMNKLKLILDLITRFLRRGSFTGEGEEREGGYLAAVDWWAAHDRRTGR